MTRIFGGQTRYVQGPGAIEQLGELTTRLTQRPLLASIGPTGGRIIITVSPEEIAAAIARVEALA
jgi:hypothetical protein